MREYVGQMMRADRGNVAGGLYFYGDRLVWNPRHYQFNGMRFELPYGEIEAYDIVPTKKKHVNIHMKNGDTYFVDIYHLDLFMMMLDQAMRESKNPRALAAAKKADDDNGEDDLEALARLAALHQSGALSDEEFEKMKAKIINS